MKNTNLINEEKQRFGDIYAEAIIKYASALERKQAMVKNCLASLENGISRQPEKTKCMYFFMMLYIKYLAIG